VLAIDISKYLQSHQAFRMQVDADRKFLAANGHEMASEMGNLSEGYVSVRQCLDAPRHDRK
jgi:hypothetical protein